MRILLAFFPLLLFFASYSFAQDELYTDHEVVHSEGDCLYIENQVDKFTKEVVKETKLKILYLKGLSESMSIRGRSVGDTKYLLLEWAYFDVFGISENSELWLLLKNEEVVKIPAAFGVVADAPSSSDMFSIWKGGIQYRISDEQISQVLSSQVTDIRIHTTDGYVDRELKKKKQWSRIGEVLSCIR